MLKWFEQHGLFVNINVDRIMKINAIINSPNGNQIHIEQNYKSTILNGLFKLVVEMVILNSCTLDF